MKNIEKFKTKGKVQLIRIKQAAKRTVNIRFDKAVRNKIGKEKMRVFLFTENR